MTDSPRGAPEPHTLLLLTETITFSLFKRIRWIEAIILLIFLPTWQRQSID
jgi:hypothetical protein